MATSTFNMRIASKGDTFQNWFANNPTPMKNEICVVTVPADAGAVVQEPAILFKVGDGVSDFKTLKFASALAADVYDWAKAAVKPTYTAEEIDGLADYISGEIEDTNTKYKLVKVDDYNYKMQSKEVDGDWTDVADSTIVIPEFDSSELEADIAENAAAIATINGEGEGSIAKAVADSAATLQEDIDAAQGDVDALATKVGTVPDDTTIVEMIAEAKSEATYDDTALAGRVTVNEGAIATLNGTGEGSVSKAVTDAVAAVVAGADASYDTLKEIADWIASDTTGAAKMQSDIVTNAAAIDALEALVGDTAVATQITNAITALGIADYATVAALDAVEARVEALEDDTHTHENKTVLDGITAAKVTAWDAAEQNAKDYADGLASDYDAAGDADQALVDAKAYTDELEGELADVAKTGDIIDLTQTAGDYIIINCGSSSEVI